MQLEETIPEEIKISDILEFVINVDGRTIDVHLLDGRSATASKAEFLDFWNNTMNGSQRVVVREFVKQLSALAFSVAEDKVSGDLMD